MTISNIEMQCVTWLKFAFKAVLLPEKAQTAHFFRVFQKAKILININFYSRIIYFSIFDKKGWNFVLYALRQQVLMTYDK